MKGAVYLLKQSIDVIERLEAQIEILQKELDHKNEQLSIRLQAETETFEHITRKVLEDEQRETKA